MLSVFASWWLSSDVLRRIFFHSGIRKLLIWILRWGRRYYLWKKYFNPYTLHLFISSIVNNHAMPFGSFATSNITLLYICLLVKVHCHWWYHTKKIYSITYIYKLPARFYAIGAFDVSTIYHTRALWSFWNCFFCSGFILLGLELRL